MYPLFIWHVNRVDDKTKDNTKSRKKETKCIKIIKNANIKYERHWLI